MDLNRIFNEIIDSNAPYWAAEYDVTYAYFTSGLRTEEIDKRWIRLQMYKEWTGAGVYPDKSITTLVAHAIKLMTQLEREDNSANLDEINYFLRFAVDEFSHYRILHDAYAILDAGCSDSIWSMGNLDEAKALEDKRSSYQSISNGPQIVSLTEGGGLGMYFGIRDALDRIGVENKLDEMAYKFGLATIQDEKGHVAFRFKDLFNVTGGKIDTTQLNKYLGDIFLSKLRERNAQFGYVYTDAELLEKSQNKSLGIDYARKYLGFLLEVDWSSSQST